MNREVELLVRHRFDRARESLAEADLLLAAGHGNTAVNRLYYASFYAVSGALLAKGLSRSKHASVRALLHQELVKGGAVPAVLGRFYDTLFDSRQKGDYTDFVRYDPEEVRPWLERTAELVDLLVRSVFPADP